MCRRYLEPKQGLRDSQGVQRHQTAAAVAGTAGRGGGVFVAAGNAPFAARCLGKAQAAGVGSVRSRESVVAWRLRSRKDGKRGSGCSS